MIDINKDEKKEFTEIRCPICGGRMIGHKGVYRCPDCEGSEDIARRRDHI
ncbi:Uncharacterised protein [uncultured archaeon]|nr:Uncharacterised protein [uncultured archaeon]